MADDTPAATASTVPATRPEKPDEAAFNQEHAKLEKELAEIKNKTVCCFFQPPANPSSLSYIPVPTIQRP